jgi:hypothetical protein
LYKDWKLLEYIISKLNASLFAPYDPLEKTTSPLGEFVYDTLGVTLTIRPVCMIGDLSIIYEWLDAALCKSNWHFNRARVTVMQHYNKMLRSGNMQSLMVEQNGLPVMQVDLLPMQLAEYPSRIGYDGSDIAIHYLYRESFRDPGIFKRGLESILSFIYAYPEFRHLYLRLTKPDLALSSALHQLGFDAVDCNNFFGASLNIYRVTRSTLSK